MTPSLPESAKRETIWSGTVWHLRHDGAPEFGRLYLGGEFFILEHINKLHCGWVFGMLTVAGETAQGNTLQYVDERYLPAVTARIDIGDWSLRLEHQRNISLYHPPRGVRSPTVVRRRVYKGNGLHLEWKGTSGGLFTASMPELAYKPVVQSLTDFLEDRKMSYHQLMKTVKLPGLDTTH